MKISIQVLVRSSINIGLNISTLMNLYFDCVCRQIWITVTNTTSPHPISSISIQNSVPVSLQHPQLITTNIEAIFVGHLPRQSNERYNTLPRILYSHRVPSCVSTSVRTHLTEIYLIAVLNMTQPIWYIPTFHVHPLELQEHTYLQDHHQNSSMLTVQRMVPKTSF